MGIRSEQTAHQRKQTAGKLSIWKYVQLHLSLKNFKLKQWDTIIHILEGLKCQTLPIPKADKNVGATETLIHCQWECKTVWPLWKTV